MSDVLCRKSAETERARARRVREAAAAAAAVATAAAAAQNGRQRPGGGVGRCVGELGSTLGSQCVLLIVK